MVGISARRTGLVVLTRRVVVARVGAAIVDLMRCLVYGSLGAVVTGWAPQTVTTMVSWAEDY